MSYIGIDEAGRGSWAGPLVAAAVCFKTSFKEPGLKDSKLLTSKQRTDLFEIIKQNCWVEFGVVSNKQIDQLGLQRANVLAVEKAFYKLKKQGSLVLDYIGGFSKLTTLTNYALHKSGESKFKEIAAASIAAKVYRDNLMIRYDRKYPGYFFKEHKGYGTDKHRQALMKTGVSEIHRLSFGPVKEIAF